MRKNLILAALLIVVAVIPFHGQRPAETHDQAALQLSPGIRFLIDLSEGIESDKKRLQKLKKDSLILGPLFKSKFIRFFEVDHLVDSLRQSPSHAPPDSAFLEDEKTYLIYLLDFLLERRRATNLLIQIVDSKIQKQQDALQFILKGQEYSTMEYALSDTLPDETAYIDPDSVNANKITLLDISVFEAERDLQLAKARYRVCRNQGEIARQLISIGDDELTIANMVLSNTQKHYVFWNQYRNTLQRHSRSKEVIDKTLRSMIDETERAVLPTLKKMNSVDSAEYAVLRTRQKALRTVLKPLSDQLKSLTLDVEKKARQLEYEKSPLSPTAIYNFFIHRGPRILILLISLFSFWFLFSKLGSVAIGKLVDRNSGNTLERFQRIDTITRAYKNAVIIIFVILGVGFLLSEIGINVTVLLGGAAIISVAIAFGTQSLVKDYFSGIMMLLENQYRIGNIVQINNITGTVEDITLRMTMLRDLDGIAHFIPHSEMKTVSNMTHEWSQVNLDIPISYNEDTDELMNIVNDVTIGLKNDPMFGDMILSAPEMLGVEAFNNSQYLIKTIVKTAPAKQWTVKRELLRRIKNRFDQLGIQMALPVQKIVFESGDSDKQKKSITSEKIISPNKKDEP